jgi:phosphopantetheinyl transferase
MAASVLPGRTGSAGVTVIPVKEGRERWVHLYEFRVPGEPGAGAWALLDASERTRAMAVIDPVRRMRFVARRAALREILSAYANRPAAALDPAAAGVCFSCSHSGEVAAVAVAARPVGVDVEVERPRRSLDRIARRMFAPTERSVLASVEGDVHRHMFHRCWVAKEAYAKGLGRGLGMRFDEFSVAAALCSWDETGAVSDSMAVGEPWTVSLATIGDRHVAVAAMGSDWELQRRTLPRPAVEVCVG